MSNLEVRSHTAVFSQFAIKFEEQVNAAKGKSKGATVAERVKSSKMDLSKKQREDMKFKWVNYPEWAEYRLGNKSGEMTILEPTYIPSLNTK